MKRRSAIRNLVIIAGGIALLPSCSGDPSKASIELTNIDISADIEKLLAEIAETIIPATADAPGAKDLNLHLFTLKMVDDCHSSEDQQQFVKGLEAFNAFAKEKKGNDFSQLNKEDRLAVLTEILKDDNEHKDLEKCLKISKQRVIQGFTQSKFVLTDMKQYEMVPGRYNGFFPVNA